MADGERPGTVSVTVGGCVSAVCSNAPALQARARDEACSAALSHAHHLSAGKSLHRSCAVSATAALGVQLDCAVPTLLALSSPLCL